MKTLAWVMPVYGPIDAIVYQNHLAAMANASKHFDVKVVGVTDKMYLHSASNELAKGALGLEVDYIFWTEMDMLIPYDVVNMLRNNGKDVCSALYFLRDSPQPCLFKHNMESKENKYMHAPVNIVPKEDLFKIDVCGMGCVLFKSEIFKKLEMPYFDLKERDPKTGLGYGQDIYFYTKVREAGVEVWVDTRLKCGHIGDKQITDYSTYKKHWEEASITREAQKVSFIQGNKL